MAENEPFLVNFAGIGVAKSGTTWLSHCLREHPQVCMAAGKETNYFIEDHPLASLPVQGYLGRSHLHEGFDWYKSRYEHHEPGQVRGEFSVCYLGAAETPGMLRDHNPAMKLICIYRNPVEAVYSAYHQLHRIQPIHEPMEVFIEKHSDLLEYFNYYTNTKRFLDVFGREQMLLMPYEDIKDDPEGVYVRVCRFIGVDDTHRPAKLHERVNPSRVVRSRFVRDVRSVLTATFAATRVTRQIRRGLMRSGVGRPLLNLIRMNEKPGHYEPMSPEMRKQLTERFRVESEQLAELMGRDLSHWNREPDVTAEPRPRREKVTA